MVEFAEIDEEFRKVFSHEELEEFWKEFVMFDKNGNGRIDAEELGLVMEEMGMRLSKEQVEDILRIADVDGNGEMDFNEFLHAMKGFHKPKTDIIDVNKIMEWLRVFADKEGNMNLEDLRKRANNYRYHLTHLGECPLEDRDVDEVFDMLEIDALTWKSVSLEYLVKETMILTEKVEEFFSNE
ncbi:calmodulin-A-like [Symsagittifera roscoffensis]|uniref:calmodulin-A-like n=1 Tax=Symsagittifera roscoffensis TaxID=84072 RepID=UPI00307B77E7